MFAIEDLVQTLMKKRRREHKIGTAESERVWEKQCKIESQEKMTKRKRKKKNDGRSAKRANDVTKREKTNEKSSRQVEVEVGAKRGTTKIVARSAKSEEAKGAIECGANNEKMKSFEKGLWQNEERELTCTMAGNNKREL